MKIETDDYIKVGAVAAEAGFSPSTAYRIARRLGLAVEVFGVLVMHKAGIESLRAAFNGAAGNPDWVKDGEKAADAAIKAVESRMARIEREGLTKQEVFRNKMLAEHGRASGGRPTKTVVRTRAAKRDA
jgi:hypothetical protein